MALKKFRFTNDLKKIVDETAKKKNWDAIVARGEAEVEIGKIDGIVMSGDSDMLFYSKIGTIIRIYHKSEILARLQLNKAAVTTLGIIPSNDYEASFYKGKINSIYNIMFDIQQSNLHLISNRHPWNVHKQNECPNRRIGDFWRLHQVLSYFCPSRRAIIPTILRHKIWLFSYARALLEYNQYWLNQFLLTFIWKSNQ